MLLTLAFAAGLSLPPSNVVLAHDWFTNQKNPVTHESCCWGESMPEAMRDCQVLEIDDWTVEGDEYVFVWPKDGKTYRFPKSQALPSQDRKGRAAACIAPWNGKARCFFTPMTG